MKSWMMIMDQTVVSPIDQSDRLVTHINIEAHKKQHTHFDHDALLLVLHGHMQVTGCTHKDALHKGSVIYLPQGQALMVTDAAECDVLIAHLKRDGVLRFLHDYSEEVAKQFTGSATKHQGILACDGSVLMREAFMALLLLDRFEHPKRLSQMKLDELLLLMLCSEVGTDLVALLRRNSYSRGDRLRFFMEKHFLEHWSLNQYANNFGMSLTAFKGLFAKIMGTTPRVWINERKMLYAHHLLITSDLSMLHIALESGFTSQSYFTQAYRRRFGFAPTQTRKNTHSLEKVG